MQERIFALAANITGAGEEELELLAALCEAAEALWRGRLRVDISEENCGEAFACGAAFSAAADFFACRSGVESFRAGELSVKAGASGEQTAALRKSAERLMAPYTQAEDFCFKEVRG